MDIWNTLLGIGFIIFSFVNFRYTLKCMKEEYDDTLSSVRNIVGSIMFFVGGILILCGRI